jgi:hypothetical protein
MKSAPRILQWIGGLGTSLGIRYLKASEAQKFTAGGGDLPFANYIFLATRPIFSFS